MDSKAFEFWLLHLYTAQEDDITTLSLAMPCLPALDMRVAIYGFGCISF
jgi:hypothetical protein